MILLRSATPARHASCAGRAFAWTPFIALAFAAPLVAAAPNEEGAPVTVFDSAYDRETRDDHRNERSTPRASVLPQTPAVARARSQKASDDDVRFAKAALLRLGYRVGRLDDRATAKFKTALFRYQRARGLSPSARLDAATRRSLGMGGS